MLIRMAPWWLVACAAVGLILCGIVAFSDTGQFFYFLLFSCMGAIVGGMAWIKYRWIEKGLVPFDMNPVRMEFSMERSKIDDRNSPRG